MPATKLASEASHQKTRARAGWGVAGGGGSSFACHSRLTFYDILKWRVFSQAKLPLAPFVKMGNNWVFRKIRLQCMLTFSLTKRIQIHWAVTFRRSNKTCPCVRKHLWRQNPNNKPVRVSRIFSRSGSVKSSIPNFNINNSKLILTAGRLIGKIKKENKNKNKMVNYICPIFSTP